MAKEYRSIADEVPAGTVSVSSSITDEKPHVYVYGYSDQEGYQAWVEEVANNEELSPSDRADLIATAPVPEETYEEALERHADD